MLEKGRCCAISCFRAAMACPWGNSTGPRRATRACAYLLLRYIKFDAQLHVVSQHRGGSLRTDSERCAANRRGCRETRVHLASHTSDGTHRALYLEHDRLGDTMYGKISIHRQAAPGL